MVPFTEVVVPPLRHCPCHLLMLHCVVTFFSNPALLKPGMLLNVGVIYRVPRLQPLPILAKYLHTTPSALRQLNPDVREDDEMIGGCTRLLATWKLRHVSK